MTTFTLAAAPNVDPTGATDSTVGIRAVIAQAKSWIAANNQPCMIDGGGATCNYQISGRLYVDFGMLTWIETNLTAAAGPVPYVPILVDPDTSQLHAGQSPTLLNGFTLQRCSITRTSLGVANAGALQVNGVRGALIEDFRYAGDAGMHGANSDGVALAFGTSAILRRLYLDNSSKGGLYLSYCRDVVVERALITNTVSAVNSEGDALVIGSAFGCTIWDLTTRHSRGAVAGRSCGVKFIASGQGLADGIRFSGLDVDDTDGPAVWVAGNAKNVAVEGKAKNFGTAWKLPYQVDTGCTNVNTSMLRAA
jgi:hypothetical protein